VSSAPYEKRNDGNDEPITEPELPIIDAHHHLVRRPGGLEYMFEDYLADINRGHKVKATVYVETQTMSRSFGPDILKPIGEVEFANGVAAMSASGAYGACQVCAAIVGFANLSAGDQIAALLERATSTAPDRLRGMRQMVFANPSPELKKLLPFAFPERVLMDTKFREGFRHLAPHRLSFEATVFHNQLDEVADLADAFPNTSIVLSHIGMAFGMGLNVEERGEVFHVWREALRKLARRPNVVCKIGGLGLPFWGFGFDQQDAVVSSEELARTWRPYVEAGIEAFGVNRCMMSSDFPEDGMSAGYVPTMNALKLAVEGYTQEEQHALFHDNAMRIYRIN
jgi:L-fuconolactonase